MSSRSMRFAAFPRSTSPKHVRVALTLSPMKINPGRGDVDVRTYVRGFYPGLTVLPKSLLWWVGFCLFALGFCAGSMLTEAFL